jgi:hypothetical protein
MEEMLRNTARKIDLLLKATDFSSGSSSSSFFVLSSYQKKECPYSILQEVLLSSAFRKVQQPGS